MNVNDEYDHIYRYIKTLFSILSRSNQYGYLWSYTEKRKTVTYDLSIRRMNLCSRFYFICHRLRFYSFVYSYDDYTIVIRSPIISYNVVVYDSIQNFISLYPIISNLSNLNELCMNSNRNSP